MTNAVNASLGLNGAAIRLVLTLDQGELAILVRDDNPGVPMAAQPGADDEGGRGLLIVENLSDRCGWYPLEDDGRPAVKVTWAVISGSDTGPAAEPRPVPVLPARRRQAPPGTAGMRTPRPVDPRILAWVKAALERL